PRQYVAADHHRRRVPGGHGQAPRLTGRRRPVGRRHASPDDGYGAGMTGYGYTLMTEQSGPRELVGHAAGGERAGFDFEVISDHYFPWLDAMGHSSYAWSVLGAVSQMTSRVELMTYVTCPIMRYHPAVVAQKAATVDLLTDGRFTLGLGAGEN